MGIEEIEKRHDGYVMRSKDGQEIVVNHIIAGIGIQPNTELAQAAGIEVNPPEAGGGIRVDEHLQTSLPDIYAAGDVAFFHNTHLDRDMRVEHADNAETMGRTAGLNMAGQPTPYDHQPFFYSDLFDLGYEAVGELDARMETFADWKEPFRKGVVYYLRDSAVRGVLLWNTWDKVDDARALIADGKRYTSEELKGKIE
jgi:NADPH-dependent 2,4-dienoyl-CoA reductase/sulfur reductase-like enzyme